MKNVFKTFPTFPADVAQGLQGSKSHLDIFHNIFFLLKRANLCLFLIFSAVFCSQVNTPERNQIDIVRGRTRRGIENSNWHLLPKGGAKLDNAQHGGTQNKIRPRPSFDKTSSNISFSNSVCLLFTCLTSMSKLGQGYCVNTRLGSSSSENTP